MQQNKVREEALARVDIRSVAARLQIEGKQSGAWISARCPLHEDSRPSFRLAVEAEGEHEKGFWICHAKCGSGSIFDLVIRTGHAKDFNESIAWMGVPSDSGPKPAARARAAKQPEPEERVVKAHESLATQPDVVRYLTVDRGITLDTIKKLRIGFWMHTNGDTAIVLPKPAAAPVDHFKVLPWPRPTRESKTARFFTTKGADAGLLYPWAEFGERPGLRVLVVESELDAALVHGIGTPAVATGGTTHFTAKMLLPLISRGYVPVLLADADVPGQEALAKCMKQLARAKVAFGKVDLELPPGCKDLGDIVLEHGREAAIEWLTRAGQSVTIIKPVGGDQEVWSRLSMHSDDHGHEHVDRTLANLDVMLRFDQRWCSRLWLNEMGHTWMLGADPLCDEDVSDVRVQLQSDYGIDWGTDNLHDRMRATCRLSTRSPVREYLLSLAWDGVPRLDSMLDDLMVAAPEQDLALKRTYLRKWMIAAVARAMDPGCKCDSMLVLFSKRQGIGKTRFASTLAGAWFSDEPIRPDDKDCRMALHQAWIVEVSELDAITRRHDLSQLRAFISKREDVIRSPYGRLSQTFKRGYVFLGTTNDRGVVREDDGRRYWPIEVLDVDVEATLRMRNQLFAEALQAYHGGEPWWLELVDEERRRVDTEARFSAEDAAEMVLRDHVESVPEAGFSTEDVVRHLRDSGSTIASVKVPGLLRKLGLEVTKLWLPLGVPRSERRCLRRWVRHNSSISEPVAGHSEQPIRGDSGITP